MECKERNYAEIPAINFVKYDKRESFEVDIQE